MSCATGLGPILYLPWGASARWRLIVTKVEDGSAVDLTGATLAWYLASSPTLPEADAELALTVGDGLTVIDALAGVIEAALSATRSAALVPFGPFYYHLKITLPNGEVLIPDQLRGKFYNDLDSLEEQLCDGAAITRLDAATGTLTPVTPDMSNYVQNRYDLTGLTGGTAGKLDALSAATLALLQNGNRLVVGLTATDNEQIRAEYVLGAKGADVEAAPWIIVCDNDPARCWRLDRGCVHKGGQPAAYNPDSAKFHRIWASGPDGAAAPAFDLTGFSFPT